MNKKGDFVKAKKMLEKSVDILFEGVGQMGKDKFKSGTVLVFSSGRFKGLPCKYVGQNADNSTKVKLGNSFRDVSGDEAKFAKAF